MPCYCGEPGSDHQHPERLNPIDVTNIVSTYADIPRALSKVAPGGHAKFDGQTYLCADCNVGFSKYEQFVAHVEAHKPFTRRVPSEADVLAARRILNRHPSLPLPGDPDQSVFGMSYEEWAKHGSKTCDDCGRSDGTHNPAVEH